MTPELLRAPSRAVRSQIMDSARWQAYRPRPDDIIIGTYSKCGTTWVQRIVSMLVFRSAAPRPIMEESPWLDLCTRDDLRAILERMEAQTHRRYLKTHLPFDALPVYEGVKYIHVGRDGRDAAMSLHNHLANYTVDHIRRRNAMSRAAEKISDDWLPVPESAAEFFSVWVARGGAQGDEGTSFFNVENSYWAGRNENWMLHVHYNDLKADREGEMHRIAEFLDIDIPATLWPELIAAASFDAMKAQGQELLPNIQRIFVEGAARFLHKGTNGRWKDVVSSADLARYDALVEALFTPDLACWVSHGRGRDNQA